MERVTRLPGPPPWRGGRGATSWRGVVGPFATAAEHRGKGALGARERDETRTRRATRGPPPKPAPDLKRPQLTALGVEHLHQLLADAEQQDPRLGNSGDQAWIHVQASDTTVELALGMLGEVGAPLG